MTLYSFCGSLRKTAKALRCSAASICRWCAVLEPKKRTGRPTKVTDAVVDVAGAAMALRRTTTCRELAEMVRIITGTKVSTQLMSVVVRTRLGLPSRGGAGPEAVRMFRDAFFSVHHADPSRVVAIDESGFDSRVAPGIKEFTADLNRDLSGVPVLRESVVFVFVAVGGLRHVVAGFAVGAGAGA